MPHSGSLRLPIIRLGRSPAGVRWLSGGCPAGVQPESGRSSVCVRRVSAVVQPESGRSPVVVRWVSSRSPAGVRSESGGCPVVVRRVSSRSPAGVRSESGGCPAAVRPGREPAVFGQLSLPASYQLGAEFAPLEKTIVLRYGN